MRSEWQVKIIYMSGGSVDLIFQKKFAKSLEDVFKLIQHDVQKAPVYKIVIRNFSPASDEVK